MSDWRERLEDAFQSREPFLGHPLKPIPLLEDTARTERVSTYVELPLLEFFEQYKKRMGARGVSEVVRRLAILGALAEGYMTDERVH
jgi:hypothetical protein